MHNHVIDKLSGLGGVKGDGVEHVEDFYDVTDKRAKAGVGVIDIESQNAKR
jgi:hypothetical protein